MARLPRFMMWKRDEFFVELLRCSRRLVDAAPPVGIVAGLDLDDVGAEVGKMAGRGRPRPAHREVDDAHAFERPRPGVAVGAGPWRGAIGSCSPSSGRHRRVRRRARQVQRRARRFDRGVADRWARRPCARGRRASAANLPWWAPRPRAGVVRALIQTIPRPCGRASADQTRVEFGAVGQPVGIHRRMRTAAEVGQAQHIAE